MKSCVHCIITFEACQSRPDLNGMNILQAALEILSSSGSGNSYNHGKNILYTCEFTIPIATEIGFRA